MGEESYENSANSEHSNDEEGTEGESGEEKVIVIGNEEKSEELACPFCLEDFDVLGLCCHIDADHIMEVKAGICTLCSVKVGINMASHVITEHESSLKVLCHKSDYNPSTWSRIFSFRKGLLEKLQFLEPDSSSSGKSSNDNSLERIQPSLSIDDKNERARCEFVQGLVLSTILDGL